jgi:hypothetical protein
MDPKIWDAGPDTALPVINDIWAKYLLADAIEANPIGMRVRLDATRGELYGEPVEARDFDRIVEDARMALREFLRRCKSGSGNLGPSMQAVCASPIRDLRRDLGKYRNDPRNLLRVVEETRRALSKIATSEMFADDHRIDRLIGNLEHREEDICIAAPEVEEEVRRRLQVRARKFEAEEKRVLTRMAAGMAADSRGVLQMVVARAALVVASDDASDAEKTAAWTFLLGAVPRGAREMSAAEQEGATADEGRRIIEKFTTGADVIVQADKVVDIAQEAVVEHGSWTTEVFTQLMSGNLWSAGGV